MAVCYSSSGTPLHHKHHAVLGALLRHDLPFVQDWLRNRKLPESRRSQKRLHPLPSVEAPEEWLWLLDQIPLQGRRLVEGRPPAAGIIWAILRYVNERGFLAKLASNACCITGGDDEAGVWTVTLYSLLVAVPGGFPVYRWVLETAGVAPGTAPGHAGPSGDVFYDILIPRAVRHATAADVKLYLREVGFRGPSPAGMDRPQRSPLFTCELGHAHWVEAACATPRLDVYKVLLQRLLVRPTHGQHQPPLQAEDWWRLLQEQGRHAARDLQPRLECLVAAGTPLSRLAALCWASGAFPHLRADRRASPAADPRQEPDGGVVCHVAALLAAPTLAINKRRALLHPAWWELVPEGGRFPPGAAEAALPALAPPNACFSMETARAAFAGVAALAYELRAAPPEARKRGVAYLLRCLGPWLTLERLPAATLSRVAAAAALRQWPAAAPLEQLFGAPFFQEMLGRSPTLAAKPPVDHLRSYPVGVRLRTRGVVHDAQAALLALAEVSGPDRAGQFLEAAGRALEGDRGSTLRAGLTRLLSTRYLLAAQVRRLRRAAMRRWSAGPAGEVVQELELAPAPAGAEGLLPRGGAQAATLAAAWAFRCADERLFPLPPAHCSPEELAWFATHPTQTLLAVKADGVFHEGGFPPGAHPPVPEAWGACTIQAEQVPLPGGGTLWLVFDVMGAELVELHQDERLELLRAGLGFPSAAAGPSGLEADERALCAHVAALPAGTADAVWVKWAWVPPANYPAEAFLRLVGSAALSAVFISDGWICGKRDLPTRFGARAPLRVIKVKPAREMTVELLWDPEQGHWVPDAGSAPAGPPPSAGIWRCGWVRGRWEPKALRAEKRAPNPEWLVVALEAFHRNPWAPEDLVAPLREQHYAAAPGAALSGATTRFLARQRGAVRAWLEAEGAGRARRVLDAGCGRGSQRVSGGEWVGVDRDPAAIAEARLRAPDATWLWCDFSGLRHPLTGERAADTALAPASFDFILCCHALTAAAASEEVWADSLASLAEAAAPGATLCVRALDPEQLFSGTPPGAALELPDGSWVRRLPPAPRAAEGAVPVRTCLAWAASAAAPRTEFLLPARHLAAAFSRTGWRAVEPAGSAETTLEPGPWELWEGATVSLAFRRAG